MKGGSNVVIEQHRHEGVFIARGKEDALVTKNLVPGVRLAHHQACVLHHKHYMPSVVNPPICPDTWSVSPIMRSVKLS